MCSVGIKESTGNVHNCLSSPVQHQIRLLRHNRYRSCLQVFLGCITKEFLFVLRRNNNCHSLLRLGNRKLRSVEAFVLLGHKIQIYIQTIRQLSDGNGNTARTEIIALLDQMRNLGSAEQSLELSFRRSISLLNLSAAGFQGLLGVLLGGAGCSAAAVTSGPAAQKNDNISGIAVLADDIRASCRAHHRADLHALCHVVRVINFRYASGRKTDLISVAGISLRCAGAELLLRELSFQRLRNRNRRICRTGHAHCLIDIASS